MTEEFDFARENDVDSIVTSESIVESSIVPPESTAEEALAAAANAIPAAGGPIVVDPYAVLSSSPAPTATGATHTYAGPTTTAYHGGPYAHNGQPTANYGYGYHPQPYGVHQPPMNGFAIAALACGVAGLMFLAPVIGSILGIVFGIIALNHVARTGERGHGLAVAGIVTGALGLLAGLSILFGLFAFLWTDSPWYGW